MSDISDQLLEAAYQILYSLMVCILQLSMKISLLANINQAIINHNLPSFISSSFILPILILFGCAFALLL